MNAKGHVFKYPDNVDTDVIIPARYLNTQDAKELASHCMEDIDKSFARIFYRNSINIGLPILECEAAADAIAAGDLVSVDFDTGLITDETTGATFQAEPFPPFIQEIIAAGGLMNSIKAKQ